MRLETVQVNNLTILFEPGQENLAGFLMQRRVGIVASLPCYSPENVDRQRGKGVFDKSIAALQKRNQLGYGRECSELTLNLVYNPQGASLPPDRGWLLAAYRRELFEHSGSVFNELFAFVNMPIQRFGSTLISRGQFNDYLRRLKQNHVAANLARVMCRSLVSVDWQGYLYDCDFNQQLGMAMHGVGAEARRAGLPIRAQPRVIRPEPSRHRTDGAIAPVFIQPAPFALPRPKG